MILYRQLAILLQVLLSHGHRLSALISFHNSVTWIPGRRTVISARCSSSSERASLLWTRRCRVTSTPITSTRTLRRSSACGKNRSFYSSPTPCRV
ncbi:hypothetical protein JB92DRAFT_3035742 [Gautieria morchelliformis]|nr:hypothetical protein JB92DRAFT_3035742 [Gautieria morchelliformis]